MFSLAQDRQTVNIVMMLMFALGCCIVMLSFCVAQAIVHCVLVTVDLLCLQCFDAVGWAVGRASSL